MSTKILIASVVVLVIIGVATIQSLKQQKIVHTTANSQGFMKKTKTTAPQSTLSLEEAQVAYFAGGCFWCIEAAFQPIPGVLEAVNGYIGGAEINPTYEEVASGQTTHVEAVKVYFDPKIVSYDELLSIFWRNIDPTDAGGQFADRGASYKTAIFFVDEQQKTQVQASKQALQDSGKFESEIVTQVLPATQFYNAEEYHQDYFEKQLFQYSLYKKGSGREDYIKDTWGDDQLLEKK